MSLQTAANPAPGFAKHPGHRIVLAPAGGRMSASVGDTTVADSSRALIMREGSYPPVTYFPRADVRMEMFSATDHHTTCPFKGEASYWSIAGTENIAWSYETPYDEMAEIKDYVAFYADKVALTEG